jgi:alginate O-acetyltransferase complex protein AlgI
MAVGLGRMFGINLPLNFSSPYKATGIIDFWRRWHMTLSRFLRDYLYIPLGGNRLGPGRRYVNMVAVMLLGGLWHGAGWNFVVWGGLHGAYLAINHGWRAWRGDQLSDSRAVRITSTIVTFIAVMVAWVFFRAESFAAAWKILTAMLMPVTLSLKLLNANEALMWLIPLLGIVFFLPNTQQFMRNYMTWDQYRIGTPRWLAGLSWRPAPVFAALMAVASAIAIVSLWQPSEFIYYQF